VAVVEIPPWWREADASSPAVVEVPASWPWWFPASWPWWREAAAPNRPRPPDPATARRHRPDPPRDAVTGRIRSPRAATGQIRLRTGSSLPSHEPPRSTPRSEEREEGEGGIGGREEREGERRAGGYVVEGDGDGRRREERGS